jgi:hypothetical protein
MSLNFFDASCQEQPRNNDLFGLCDNQNGTKAYSNIDNPSQWIASVINKGKIDVIFTAIDKCLIKDDEFEGMGRCDGMLTTSQHIYFVELKNQKKDWKKNAIRQLESTIKIFKSIHDITKYKHKKAFVCNKCHKKFNVIDNEDNLKFFRKYGLRIDVQADLIII